MNRVDALAIAAQVMEQYANNDKEVEEALNKILQMKSRIQYESRHARMGYGLRPDKKRG